MSLRYADFFRGARGVSGAKELFTTCGIFSRRARGGLVCAGCVRCQGAAAGAAPTQGACASMLVPPGSRSGLPQSQQRASLVVLWHCGASDHAVPFLRLSCTAEAAPSSSLTHHCELSARKCSGPQKTPRWLRKKIGRASRAPRVAGSMRSRVHATGTPSTGFGNLQPAR